MIQGILLFLSLFILATHTFGGEYVLVDKNQQGTIGSPTKPFRKAYLGSLSPIVLEGSITNDYKTTIIVTEPTKLNYITLPDDSGTLALAGAVDAAKAVWFVDNGLNFEGDTADAYEATLSLQSDPTADTTIKLPSLNNSALMVSNLTTNDINAANSIWGTSNGIVAEGSTADANETTFSFNNPTVDSQYNIRGDITSGTVSTSAGLGSCAIVETISGTTTLSPSDCGKLLLTGVDGITITLGTASASPGGTINLFVTAAHGTAQVIVAPQASDTIIGFIHYYNSPGAAYGVEAFDGPAGTKAKVTKAIQRLGHHLKLISDGVDRWYIQENTASYWIEN